MSKKIQLPEWVYRNLDLYGNCALPDTKYTTHQLYKHLVHRTGKRIRIRPAIFKQFNPRTHKTLETTYYVAEIL